MKNIEIELIKKFIKDNYVSPKKRNTTKNYSNDISFCCSENFEVNCVPENLKKRLEENESLTWEQKLFSLIDEKNLKDVDVYKDAGLTKQTFSKIRSDKNYHPDKNTAIQLCISLKLNYDETLDLLSLAGYTLSHSIKKDLVVRYFIENGIYNIYDIDIVLEQLNLKQFLKY